MSQDEDQVRKYLEIQKQFEALEQVVKQKLSKEAIARYGNIKAAHPEKAMQVITALAQLVQQGQIQETITDDLLKQILLKLQEPKKEFKIARK